MSGLFCGLNMPAGRPSKYGPKMVEKARDYLEHWKDLGDKIPSHIGLQQHCEIGNTTLYNWSHDEDKAEFREILDQILRVQQMELINNGLSGDFNSAITKLVLGKHGFHDKQDSTVAGPDGGPVTVVERVIVKATDSNG